MIFVKVAERAVMYETKKKKRKEKSLQLQQIILCFMAYIDKAHPDKHSYALLSPYAYE